MWTEEEIEALRQMYSDVRISREKMVGYFERTWQAICIKAWKLGLSRPRISQNQISHDYFHEVTISEQAYWLGWLAADGHVAIWQRCYTICLELQKRDLCIVERFRNSVAPGVPIHETAKSYYVRFGSKAMFQDLAIYGIGPNKTEHFVWPSALPEAFTSDFILGYFDGDGCLGQYMYGRKKRLFWILNGTKLFLNTVKYYLDSKAQVKLSEPMLVHKDRSPHLFKIVASSREAVCRIDALINVSGLGLTRKHL